MATTGGGCAALGRDGLEVATRSGNSAPSRLKGGITNLTPASPHTVSSAARNLSASTLARRADLGEDAAVRMLYRAFLILITGLFITMWTLLIRSEVRPGGNSLRAIPMEHVLRDLFQPEKASSLNILNGNQRIGTFQLGAAPDGTLALQYFGNALIDLPGADSQRSAWKGEIVFTPDWKLKTFTLSVKSRGMAKSAGPATEFDFTLSPLEQTASYMLKSGSSVVDEQTFTTDEAGLVALLEHFEVDPMLRKQLRPGQSMKPVVTAHEASLVLRDVKLETSLITVSAGGQTLLEAHVSKLGEVLQVPHTLLGWTLEVP